MAGERILLAGYVQYPDNFPVDRIAYHARGAGPRLDSRAEVLSRVNLHRVSDGERGADGVRAAGALVPVRAGDEPDIPGRIHRGRVARRLEDRAGRIREDHDGARLGQEVADLLHDPETRPDEVTMPVLKREERFFGKRRRRLRALGIDSHGLTPHPGPFDDTPDYIGRQFTSAQEPLPERHHLGFLIRMRERGESLLHNRHHMAPSSPVLPRSCAVYGVSP